MSGHTYTHTHDNYYNPRCAHAHRGLIRKSSNSASNCYDDPIPVCHIEGRCLQKARIYRQD